jgi:hypothetical protein
MSIRKMIKIVLILAIIFSMLDIFVLGNGIIEAHLLSYGVLMILTLFVLIRVIVKSRSRLKDDVLVKKKYYWVLGLMITTIAIVLNLLKTDNIYSQIFSYSLLIAALVIIIITLIRIVNKRHHEKT